MSGRVIFLGVLGVLMILLGAYLALRPLIAPGRPLTPTWWLDATFALFFLVRGWLALRRMQRIRETLKRPPDA